MKSWFPTAVLLTTLLSQGTVTAAELRLAVDSSTEMPWAEIRNDQLSRGIHRDLGDALALQLNRTPTFLVLPRQRLSRALSQGDVDVACVLSQEWLPGPFSWTDSFLDDADLVLSVKTSPAPQRMDDLADVAVGTVHGFRYPAIEQALGIRFRRDDAPNATNNLRKLQFGRIQHAIANERFVNYQRRQGLLRLELHPALVISRNRTGCAISRRSEVVAADVSAAVERLLRSGAIARLLARYR